MSDQERIERLEHELTLMKEALALMRQISAVQDKRITNLENSGILDESRSR